MMKKLLCLPLLIALLTLSNVAPAGAEEVFQNACNGVTDSVLCSESNRAHTLQDNGLFGVNGILNKVANFLLVIIGVVAVIMIIVGGIQYTLSGGDSQRINKAKDMIIYAIVGLIVALIAKGVIAFVINRVA